VSLCFFFFQAEDGIRDFHVTGVQTCALPISMSEPIRLTQYSHGAGCGCKISPKVLETILAGSGAQNIDPRLWVGNASRDDAAVYALDDERGVVSTTDFFMPIVDDPFDFG